MMQLTFLAFILLAGGEASLSDYANMEAYFARAQMTYEEAALQEILTEEPEVPTEEEVKTLIGQLGHPERKQRDAAEEALVTLGHPARAFIAEFVRDADPEIAARSRRLMGRIPEKKLDRAEMRLMAIRGLNDFESQESRDLLADIVKGDDAKEAELATAVLAKWRKDPADARQLEARDVLMKRLPASTCLTGQLTRKQFESPFKNQIRTNQFLQNLVLGFLDAVGDIEVHRVTAAVNREMFQDEEDLRLVLFIEGKVDALRMARFLMRTLNFKPVQSGDMVYLTMEHFFIWPMSDERFLVIIAQDGAADEVLKIAQGFADPGEQSRLNDTLTETIQQTNDNALFWGAMVLLEEHNVIEKGLNEVMSSVRMEVKLAEDSLEVNAVGAGAADADGAKLATWAGDKTMLLADLKSDLQKMIGRHRRHRSPGMQTTLDALKTTKLEPAEDSIQMSLSIPFNSAATFFQELQEDHQRMIERRRQRMQRRGGDPFADPFGFQQQMHFH